jgi:hypothetical protein
MYNKAKNFKPKEVEKKQFVIVEKPKVVDRDTKSVKKESKPVIIGAEILDLIFSEKEKSEKLLNNFEMLNNVIGEYIFKKKCNNKEYENKVKAEEDKKEIEQSRMMKKLEEQINEVMSKVDTTLQNAKNAGKKLMKKQE